MTISIDQLRKSNNELDHKLNPHNAAIMTDIVVYLRVGSLSDLQVEIIRQDLLDMALAAQERGEDISQVIGSDPKAFCDDILRNGIPSSKLDKAKEAVSIVANSAAILLLIHLLFMKSTFRMIQSWFTGDPADYDVPISVGLLFSTAILIAAAWSIVQLIGKQAFKPSANRPQKRYLRRFLWGAIVGIATATYLFLVIKLNTIVLFSVHIAVLLGVIAGLFLIGRWTK